MEKVDVLGAMINFDERSNTATFKFDFVDTILISQIESLLQHKKPIKFSFKKVKPFRSKTYMQQKKFWVDFTKILLKMKIPNTKENSDQLYWFIKCNIFPSKKVYIGYDQDNAPVYSPYPPEMKDLSIEEMTKVIEDLHNYYSYLQIDWDKVE